MVLYKRLGTLYKLYAEPEGKKLVGDLGICCFKKVEDVILPLTDKY